MYLCKRSRNVSTSHAANLDEQDVALELSDKHLENSVHFLCIIDFFNLFEDLAI